MALVEFAKEELSHVDFEYGGQISASVLAIIELFAGQGHSGGSANITIGVVERLMRFQPLTDLTGEDTEWTEVGDGIWQNKRCPSVFKDTTRAWDIELPNDGKAWATITFPYLPGAANYMPGAAKYREQTSARISSIAGDYMNVTGDEVKAADPEVTAANIRSMAASLATQDETKGQDEPKGKEQTDA